MVLKVEIVSSPEGVVLPEAVKTISDQGGSLGRGENNTWILEDPERFISSRHCEFSFDAGQYFISDLSTNGTFVNGSPEPLGRANRMVLNSGDTVELGEYKFVVKIEAAEFDDFGSGTAAGGAVLDPFSASPSPFDAQPFPADSGSEPMPIPLDAATGHFSPEELGSVETDPLAALDKAAAEPFAGSTGNDSLPNDAFDMNANPEFKKGEASFPYGQSTYSDNADPLSGSFEPPSMSPPSGLIPEDWEEGFDLLGSTPSAAPSAAPIEPVDSFPEPAAPVAKPSRPKPAAARPARQSQASQPARRKSSASPALDIEAAKPPLQRPKKTHAPASTSSNVSSSMLDAMGLKSAEISPEEREEIALAIGELMPVVVEGMMRVLRSRASIKNEFRMNVTTIQPIENNPLKFSADAQEAMENMFTRKSKAYKGPVDAFAEGFTTISEHQVAIVAGIRAAFSKMVEHFDPETLERQFDRQSKKSSVSLPGMQKARYWSSYTDYYQSFIDNMEQSFQNLFGDEFVRAYEDQLFQLMSARNKDK